MSMHFRFLFAAVAFVLAVDTAAGDNVYRWTDKDGHVHYGDQPAADAHATIVTPALPTSGDNSSTRPSISTGPALSPEECKSLHDKLTTYRAASSITETDALGTQHAFTAEERQRLIDLTTTKISQSCSAPSSP